ncbi:MAG: biotin--[acetyl-CoA-carboxylase] ligase [candidate division Zixibacteria bacterium]|nr:biotin--[acetyl-CoA-carboxylase] ligase [candidate division Zixibacteria bacterium]
MAYDITQLQIDVLNELRSHPRSYLSIRQLADSTNQPPQLIARALKELENWGYGLLSNAEGGVRYGSSPDVLFPHEIEHGLEARLIAQNIFSLDRVGSTNTLAHKYAERGQPEGTLIIAERQTAGKGRLGRTWHSPAGCGLYFSLILRPPISPAQAPGISLITALAIVEAIRASSKLKAQLKWPNDVLCEGCKVAGVLTELAAELDRVRYVVVGIGINVNHQAEDFPPALRDKAGSLRQLVGAPIDRIKLLQLVLSRFEFNYQRFVRSGLKDAVKSIRRYSAVLGKPVSFQINGEHRSGRAVDIDGNGLLVVEVNGKTMTLGSGEISLAENY